MALQLLGGSFLSAFLQVLFDRMASRRFLDFFKEQKLNNRLLEKLKTTMISVEVVLDDSEAKEITRPAVKKWLGELKDAVYEADDFFDEIAYEALRLEMEAESQTSIDNVRNFFSSHNPLKREMEANLEKIIDRVQHLVKQKDVLGLRESIGEKALWKRIPTTSLVDESDVYGRDEDKKVLMKLVLSDDANGNNLGVIPIVGMGGVGKTTLAQLVYNDSRVKGCFDLNLWVCASEEFNVFKVTRDILQGITSATSDAKTPDQLQLELKEKLMGKKFLLVLDDVWNENYAEWDVLQRPLRFGAQGSKIIVTTRNERVAAIMGTVTTHYIKELSDDDCLFLFARHAFGDGNSSAQPDLEVFGREIVRKCKGLPLAAKTMGGLLRSKRNVEEWKKVLKSHMWNWLNDNILPALRLSYHYLPSHLKRCFAYCAIFPKGYQFKKEELVLLWMAEGFSVKPEGDMEIVEVIGEYFDDLVSRSFFQQCNDHNRSCFIMHDLINDLAQFVSQEFCFRMGGENPFKTAKKTRHLSYAIPKHDASKKFQGIQDPQLLRTFLPVDYTWKWQPGHVDELMQLLPTLKRLRVLSLVHYRIITKLPDSIGNLKHLRYLDLSGTSVKRLPESVTHLYNLQTVMLVACVNFIELPANMGRLINLCHLDIGGTRLQEMPLQMGKLTKLQTLTDFILGKQSGSGIEELGKLQLVQGALAIRNLQNVLDTLNALRANLKGKMHLKELLLEWNDDATDSVHNRGVLEQLQPHTNVESLSIFGYGGTKFPDWVGDSSFSNMLSLELSGCEFCCSLPPLGQLVSLKDLSIIEFSEVVVVGPEFYGSCKYVKKPFRSLETLRFESMPQWCEWISYADEDEGEAFPLLRELYIIECPKLIKALPTHLPSLTTLEIRRCQQLVASLPKAPNILRMNLRDNARDVLLQKLPSGWHSLKVGRFHSLSSLLGGILQMGVLFTDLEEIEIKRGDDSLKCFPLEKFPKLKSLCIIECSILESPFTPEATHRYFTSLGSLKISDCCSLVSFPRGGLPAPNLKVFRLENCSNMKSLPDCMHSLLPSLVNLSIYNCPELGSFPEGGLPSKLESLDVGSCNKLIARRMQWGLQILPYLSHFSIGRYKDMESFPEETLLPETIISLGIFHLQNLKSLDYKGLQHFTSLKKLEIEFCPNLQSMPEMGLPSSLTTLKVFDLPNLESLVNQGFQHLTSLTKLTIGNCPKLPSVPEEGLPPTLTSLTISSCQNLKSLNSKGLQNLTFLGELIIYDCPELQSMPEEGLPSSLSSLVIWYCHLLPKRCQREKGEDWPKISHIPNIQINGYYP